MRPSIVLLALLTCACDPGAGPSDAAVPDARGADAPGLDVPGADVPRLDAPLLPTDWEPATHDENFDRADCRITGFPAVISYGDAPSYPSRIGALRHFDDAPVGTCEIVEGALLGVAPAQRCTFTRTHQDASDPAVGGDPYGFGQTYLGPCDATIDPSLGEVTALSIGFVWQFGAGWLEAMEQRQEHAEDRLWGAPYEDVEVGGTGGKPLITQREHCEYWYDVSASLGTSTARMTGTLEAPDGIVEGSLEIEIGDAYFYDDGGTLRSASGDDVGSVSAAGTYDLRVPSGLTGTATAYYRTTPPGDDPDRARHQRDGVWREPRASASCRERPMALAGLITSFTDGEVDPLAAMSLTMGDDIACYCYDWDGASCHELGDDDRRTASFRIGSVVHDDDARGLVHVGVEEPIWVELVIDTVNDVLDLYVTTPDGRLNDTLVSHTSFCDSATDAAVRQNQSPHRYGRLVSLGEPFWSLPVTTIPADTWHQVGQWRIVGATDGAPVTRQGPPPGFVRD